MHQEWFLFIVTAAIALPAAIIDVRHHRVPNEICLAGVLLGVAFNVLNHGFLGLGSSLMGLFIAFSIGFPLWLMGWFGAGDAKLVSAVGAIVGINLVLPVMAGIAIAGGVFALIYVMAMRASREPLGALIAAVVFPEAKKGSSLVAMSVEKEKLTMKGIPYAVPVAFGSLAAIVYMY